MIECIPNVSEGRNRSTLDGLVQAVAASGCRVLDLHVDPDHNRSVLTFVGDEDALFHGVLALAREAAAAIDLRTQRGVHPRMGAVDVIPFVSLDGATEGDAIRLAHRVGKAIGNDLGVPVFLYEAAATSEPRRNLASIRRGQYEGLQAKLDCPEWTPDYGPRRVHPSAGVTAVGARGFLVAYNVVLGTDDVAIARAVASTIRESNGGPKGLKALGLPIASRGLVQVSMNLTEVETTGLLAAFESVEAEAEARGVDIVDSEVVGLVPKVAALGASTERIRLDRELNDVILEDRLASA